MVEPLGFTRVTEELSYEINRQHISYLQAEESPNKIELRIKLEGFIRKYLCLVAHGRKFIFPEIAEILRRSVELKDNFSGYRASTAWNALARYAANLVAQPWRKEFTVIKTFSGFYMHDVEENLVGAELLLDRMGYKQVDRTSLVLQQPLDLDAVMAVSRDAIVAFVECQMMKEIWEGVSSLFKCSWREVLAYREHQICSPESAIKEIIYRYHSNQFQQQHIISGITNNPYGTIPRYHQHPEASCLYGHSIGSLTSLPYYGYPTCSSFAMPPQPRYGCLVSPPHAVGYPVSPVNYHQHPKSPSEMLPANGYIYTHAPQMVGPHTHNGYVAPQSTSSVPQNYGCVVPTGQLIELDNTTPATSQLHSPRRLKPQENLTNLDIRNGSSLNNGDKTSNSGNNGDTPRKECVNQALHDVRSPRPTTFEDLRPKRNGVHVDHVVPSICESSFAVVEKCTGNKFLNKHISRKGPSSVAPMQDGTGTWESWDYVYRNLESQGYNKDVGERGDILHNASAHKGSGGSAGSSQSFSNANIHCSRKVRDTEVSANKEDLSSVEQLGNPIQLMQLSHEEPVRSRGVDVVDARGNMLNNMLSSRGSPVREKITSKMAHLNKVLLREHRREMDNCHLTNIDTKQNRKVHDTSVVKSESSSFWECTFCTYHNKVGRDICDMCSKSRAPGNEGKPLVSGGRECPKCTLVNDHGVSSCQACNESLKNSPTYI